MRESPLGSDPGIHPVTLPVLVAIARAIERESVQRYETLSATMERRGEKATAAAFRIMLDEERKHVDAVERWAASLGEPLADESPFEWRLPADLATSWDDIVGSARLTPYRAFAIAVDNERRAFTLYSYLAAAATDERVAAEAERLALEELGHASLMRRWRRQAWHLERRTGQAEAPAVATTAALHALLARHERDIAGRHRAIAARLRSLGDDESAGLLERFADERRVASAPAEEPPGAPPAADDPVHLLVAAQEPLEAFSEALEGVLRTTEGELFAEVERALADVVARLSAIAVQTSRRTTAAA
ncbi:MAG: hypothetical protein ABI641_04190 [Caldimonas sp.]